MITVCIITLLWIVLVFSSTSIKLEFQSGLNLPYTLTKPYQCLLVMTADTFDSDLVTVLQECSHLTTA